MPKIWNIAYGVKKLWEFDWVILKQNHTNKPIINEINSSAEVKVRINSWLQTARIQIEPTT